MINNIKYFSFAILLFYINTVYAATFSAQLDVNPVLLSDSFQLTYTAEGAVDAEPDFSPVAKDFDILGTRQSSNISMINGDFKRTKQWTLTLRAKNSGTFRVAAISFGKEQAPEVEIIVKDVAASSVTSPTQDFLVELETSKKSVFVQEQIIITARLLIAQNINSYQFSDLHVSDTDTIIESLGKDKQYKTYRGTKPYIIIEKKFAIFPQHAGKLQIQPFIAEIGIVTQNSRGNIFDPFNQHTTTKRIQSSSTQIQIQPKPASFTADNWLPTSSLKLSEDWPHNSTFYTGEPITRTITLLADGLSSVQLPEIKHQSVTNLKQYPDKAALQDTKTDKGLASSLKQKIALIPTQAGNYTLPAIDIPWWNTKTRKVDIAHISKREFTVLASPSTQTSQSNLNQPKVSNSNSDTSTPSLSDKKSETPASLATTATSSNPVWMWLSSLLLILWLTTLLLWWRSSQSNFRQVIQSPNINSSVTTRLKYLKAACSKNNPQDVKSALLEWANSIWPHTTVHNLSDLADMLGSPLREKILALNTNLYSSKTSPWQCGELYKLCSEYKIPAKGAVKKKNSAELEKFNKS